MNSSSSSNAFTPPKAKTLKTPSSAKHILIILGTSILFGAIYDLLFYGKTLGISFPVFIILFTAAMLATSYAFKIKIKTPTYLLIIPLLFFSTMVFVRESHILTPLNILFSIYIILLLTKSVVGEKIQRLDVADYIKLTFSQPLIYFAKIIEYLEEVSGLKKHLGDQIIIGKILKGIVMAIPLLIVFFLLFLKADMVFEQQVSYWFSFDVEGGSMSRLIVFLIVSGFLAGLFYNLLKPYNNNNGENIIVAKVGIIEVSVILGLINALFLLFLSIQITYIFGGQSNISYEGFTYAEYARKGFFELLAVAILSFFVIWFTDKLARAKHEAPELPFKILSTLLSAQVMVIMYSSFARLALYEEAYGFTEIRFYSHAFTIFLGIIFLLLIYKIIFNTRENIFALNAFIICILALATLNIINPDAFIANQNIERFNRTEKLDIYYLNRLSDDAIPTIVENIKSLKNSEGAAIQLKENTRLKKKYEKMTISTKYTDWQSFNLSRYMALTKLESIY